MATTFEQHDPAGQAHTPETAQPRIGVVRYAILAARVHPSAQHAKLFTRAGFVGGKDKALCQQLPILRVASRVNLGRYAITLSGPDREAVNQPGFSVLTECPNLADKAPVCPALHVSSRNKKAGLIGHHVPLQILHAVLCAAVFVGYQVAW